MRDYLQDFFKTDSQARPAEGTIDARPRLMEDEMRDTMVVEASDLPAGIFVHGTTTAGGGSATLRLVLHNGLALRDAPEKWRKIIADDAVVQHAAIYSEAIVANGWEPHAQPSPAAYLPRTYGDLVCAGMSREMHLFVDAQPRRGRATHYVHPEQTSTFVFAAERSLELRAVARLVAGATGTAPRDILALLTGMVRGERSQLTRAA